MSFCAKDSIGPEGRRLGALSLEAQLLDEGRAEQARREREEPYAEDRDGRAEDPPETRDRDDVAVAHGGQRDDRPPHRRRDAAERFWLCVRFGPVERCCAEEEQRTHQGAGRHQLVATLVEDPPDLERRGGDVEEDQDGTKR